VRQLGVSKHFVTKWTKDSSQDVTIDHRGWPLGKRRKCRAETEERIYRIYNYLKEEASEFFYGATAISREWHKRYPEEAPPPLRTIGQIMKDLDLSKPNKTTRSKGAARYLCYPEHSIYGGAIGTRVIEADLIVRRYLKGSGAALHFIGFSAKKSPRIRYFERIESLTADNFIDGCERFFHRFEVPDALKVDNAATFVGSLSGKRSLSKTILYLLDRKVCPVFSVPRRPFSKASIEDKTTACLPVTFGTDVHLNE